MNAIDNLRNNIIDKLLTISNKEYLNALYKLVENYNLDNNAITLTETQIKLLKLSETDIENGNITSQNELDKQDLEWIKNL